MDSKPEQIPPKPVASLKSHFEALHGIPASREPDRGRYPPNSLRPVDGVSSIRASFDGSRSSSPWLDIPSSNPEDTQTSKRRDDSPAKPTPRRPLSVFGQLPSNFNSPSSLDTLHTPSQGAHNRTDSRSPERQDIKNRGRFRESPSRQSSRPSSRPVTPLAESSDNNASVNAIQKPDVPLNSTQEQSKPSIKPPLVNRAQKPDIPAKPNLSRPSGPSHGVPDTSKPNLQGLPQNSNLTPHASKPSSDPKTSPFNTPPGSTGSRSPSPEHEIEIQPAKARPAPPPPPQPRQIGAALTVPFAQEARRSNTQTPPPPPPGPRRGSVQPEVIDLVLPKPNDSRLSGFGKSTPSTTEQRDTRLVAFGGGQSIPPAREPVTPARANTVTDKSSMKDARDLGVSNPRFTQRHVSENVRQTSPPPTASLQSVVPQSVPALKHQVGPSPNNSISSSPVVRDPRMFGFSSPVPKTTGNPTEGQSITSSRGISRSMAPSPRQSVELQRPTARQIPPVPTGQSERPIKSTPDSTPISGTSMSIVDPRFPPPPKRDPHPNPLPRFNAVPDKINDSDSDGIEDETEEPNTIKTDYPDMTKSNRRPPIYNSKISEINTKSDSRVFDIWEKFLCTTGYSTRVFDITTGETLFSTSHGETVKVLSAVFKPAPEGSEEGLRLWLGNNIGEIQELDVNTGSVAATTLVHNRREIVRMLRYRSNVWTVDEDGKLFVWKADESGAPNLRYSPISHKVPKGHTFSCVIDDKLWYANGKELRVFKPGHEPTFTVLNKPLVQSTSGDVTSGAYSVKNGGQALFGHADGKITIYSTQDYSHIATVKASDYKINDLSFVGDWLWAAFKTGKVYVYDTSTTPWIVKKDWSAHKGPVAGLLIDPSGIWRNRTMRVVTIGHDNYARAWDGLLEEDWLEQEIHARDTEFCSFRDIRAAIVTWNVGAITPDSLRSEFIADAIHSDDPPELLVFGFQEVVDLEDRAVTAKSILGFGKRKDPGTSEQYQSRVYREWRDYLSRFLDRHASAGYAYKELQTSSLIGLCQCVFIRQDEKDKIRSLSPGNLKCGIKVGSKAHYGNKGALLTRFVLDDSSFCFINCHLAAGQKQTAHRNNDVFTIMEADALPGERSADIRSSIFVSGGDGAQILDHEICIINGDLNYRIDALPRDSVINLINRKDFSKLLERDQLMLSRKRVSGFRLNAFMEMPLNFAPTYKYDLKSDRYDTSEKKRSPAWCDRILYRGAGRVKQLEYRRHEVDVSDHRPVSGLFRIKIKSIDAKKRQMVMEDCKEKFTAVKTKLIYDACIEYLVHDFGITEKEARKYMAG